MNQRVLFVFTCVFALVGTSAAQIRYYQFPDSNTVKENARQKIAWHFECKQKYDSTRGRISEWVDTNYYHVDRSGRNIEFSYKNDDGSRAHVWYFYDKKGREIRRVTCDDDSTNGFVYYWLYNDKNQKIRETVCSRKNNTEDPFTGADFIYDDNGQLQSQEDYYLRHLDKHSITHTYFFRNIGKLTTSAEYDSNGKLDKTDTTIYTRGLNNYREWTYWDGKISREHSRTCDTVDQQIIRMYLTKVYDSDGRLRYHDADTSVERLDGQMIEFREILYIEKYFYDKKGEYRHSIKYNRQGQPIEKRYESFVYYQ